MGWFDTLLGGAGTAYMAEDIKDQGAAFNTQAQNLAKQLATDSAFKGYGVTTGLGTSTIAPNGTMNLGVNQNAGMSAQGQGMYGGAQAGFQNAQTAAMAGANNAYGPAAYNALQQNMSNQAYNPAMNAQNAAMMGLGGQQAQGLGASNQAMMNAMGSTAGREQDIYDRAMAMQNPALNRAQAQSEARQFAQGRGGVMGTQFGGTGEDLAMAKARAEAGNTAAFNAMNQAQTEMMNQGQLASQFGQLGQGAAGLQSNIGNAIGNLGMQNAQLGQSGAGLMQNMGMQNAQLSQALSGQLSNIANAQGALGLQGYDTSYLPMRMQLLAMQEARGGADMAQTGQLTGTGYGAQLGLGGIQANMNAEKTASELYGNLFDSILDNSGSSSSTDSLGNVVSSAGNDFINYIKGLI